MNGSPLILEPVFHIGLLPITSPVLITWAIMAGLTVFSLLATRRLSIRPGRLQAVLELIVTSIDQLIQDTMQVAPAPYRSLIGTILIYVLIANWSSLVPGIEPPTAHLETDAALAGIVFCATIYFGLRTRGLAGYLKTFAEPSWVMIPLNVVEQITRTFSLIVRLFGNVMSGVFIVGIILSLAGLLVPIPLMALDLLTGAVQAYIFAVLATVFIGASVGEGRSPMTAPIATPAAQDAPASEASVKEIVSASPAQQDGRIS
ncbi:MAG TPA: F0F1 ATP synthase subunit A [Terriglobia bacterium]|nr:F0F1 ATP synthase subunit A [Terriglobia bacterium]